ncbi:hypothetical protein IID62_00215, partial [candidate division KSB1 bacterium]|nr:hypothetical protein [candidate division KSB1 bacterium]
MNEFRDQGALTIIAEIKSGEKENLRTLLKTMVYSKKDNPDVDVETNA